MSLENIGKTLLQTLESERAGIGRNGLARSLENGPQIIDAVAMISMVMRPDHCVDMINAIVEKLVAQIRRRIDQYPGRFAFHQN